MSRVVAVVSFGAACPCEKFHLIGDVSLFLLVVVYQKIIRVLLVPRHVVML